MIGSRSECHFSAVKCCAIIIISSSAGQWAQGSASISPLFFVVCYSVVAVFILTLCCDCASFLNAALFVL